VIIEMGEERGLMTGARRRLLLLTSPSEKFAYRGEIGNCTGFNL
jgi:hypothetical protein